MLAPIGAKAQKLVEISGSDRTATVNVAIGKSIDVRTDQTFTDVTVGDPEVADVNVLTDRSLSILGRKSGTTRIAAYGDDKRLIGLFDIEVSYDTSGAGRGNDPPLFPRRHPRFDRERQDPADR